MVLKDEKLRGSRGQKNPSWETIHLITCLKASLQTVELIEVFCLVKIWCLKSLSPHGFRWKFTSKSNPISKIGFPDGQPTLSLVRVSPYGFVSFLWPFVPSSPRLPVYTGLLLALDNPNDISFFLFILIQRKTLSSCFCQPLSSKLFWSSTESLLLSWNPAICRAELIAWIHTWHNFMPIYVSNLIFKALRICLVQT